MAAVIIVYIHWWIFNCLCYTAYTYAV